uniref:Uncharacterized protein n=1 Tax=Arundo donax TaxID=35708 RepID=A0A0A8YL83_ARUDO
MVLRLQLDYSDSSIVQMIESRWKNCENWPMQYFRFNCNC